mgnify:FL=1
MKPSTTELLKDPILQLMVLTMEECGELIQACSKALRKNNPKLQLLKDEIGDVYAMIQLMQEFDIVSYDELDERVKIKRDKLRKWSDLV